MTFLGDVDVSENDVDNTDSERWTTRNHILFVIESDRQKVTAE